MAFHWCLTPAQTLPTSPSTVSYQSWHTTFPLATESTPEFTSAVPPALPFCWASRWGSACSMTALQAITSRSASASPSLTAQHKHSPTAARAYSTTEILRTPLAQLSKNQRVPTQPDVGRDPQLSTR